MTESKIELLPACGNCQYGKELSIEQRAQHIGNDALACVRFPPHVLPA